MVAFVCLFVCFHVNDKCILSGNPWYCSPLVTNVNKYIERDINSKDFYDKENDNDDNIDNAEFDDNDNDKDNHNNANICSNNDNISRTTTITNNNNDNTDN